MFIVSEFERDYYYKIKYSMLWKLQGGVFIQHFIEGQLHIQAS